MSHARGVFLTIPVPNPMWGPILSPHHCLISRLSGKEISEQGSSISESLTDCGLYFLAFPDV